MGFRILHFLKEEMNRKININTAWKNLELVSPGVSNERSVGEKHVNLPDSAVITVELVHTQDRSALSVEAAHIHLGLCGTTTQRKNYKTFLEI